MLILSLVFDKSKETDTLNLNLASYLNPFAKQKRMHLEVACDSLPGRNQASPPANRLVSGPRPVMKLIY